LSDRTPVTSRTRTRARSIYTRAFNGQQYFATPLPRRNFRLLLASREEAQCARVLRSASRRRDSSVGACVRTRSLVRGHAPASLPWSLSACPTACLVPLSLSLSLFLSLSLYRASQLSSHAGSRQCNVMHWRAATRRTRWTYKHIC